MGAFLRGRRFTLSGSHFGNSPQPLREIGSKAVGSLSVSYTSGKTGFESESGSYYLTKYGQRYLELKKLVTPHFGLVR